MEQDKPKNSSPDEQANNGCCGPMMTEMMAKGGWASMMKEKMSSCFGPEKEEQESTD